MVQKREVEYAKELDDVMVLFVELVRDVKAGKGAGEIAAGSLPELMEAISGANQLESELANSRKVALQTIGYRVGELTDALLSPKSASDGEDVGGGDPV